MASKKVVATTGLIVLLAFLVVTSTTVTVQDTFKLATGYRLEGESKVSSTFRKGMTALRCVNECLSLKCRSATYSSQENACMTFQEPFFDSALKMTVSSSWSILYRIEDTEIQVGNWTLVFRGQSRIGSPLHDMWNSIGVAHDSPIGAISEPCLRMQDNLTCGEHFRSQILDQWQDRNISQVRYSMYKKGVEFKHITFNGTGTDRNSWFRQNRIVESSWSNLDTYTDIPNIFSIQGYTFANATRRFLITQNGTCKQMKSVTMTLDSDIDECGPTWSIPKIEYPLILFASTQGLYRMSVGGFGRADYMGIYVKFK